MRKNAGSTVTIKYYFIICIYTVIDFLFGPGYTVFMQSKGLSVEKIGIILSVWSVFSFIFEIPSGSIADKYGRKRAMTAGFAIWGMGLILYAFSNSMVLFTVSFLGIALGMSLISGTPEAWYISKSAEDKNYRPDALSTAQSLSLFLSIATGILFTFVTGSGKQSLPYILSGGISLLFCFVLLRFYEENFSKQNMSHGKLSYYVGKTWKKLWGNRVLRLFLAKTFLMSLASQLFILGWQLYIVEKFTLRSNLLGLLLSFLTGMLAIGFFAASRLYHDMENGVKLSKAGNYIMVVGILVICLADGLTVFMLGATLLELGLGLEKGADMIWIQEELDEEIRSTSLSFFEVFRVIAAFGAGLCISVLVPQITFGNVWYISLSAGIMASIVLTRIHKAIYLKL